MNTSNLTFTANDQELVKNSGMDEYASNTVSYIKATFTLGENWSGFDSVRAVWSSYYNIISTVLDTNNSCLVPAEMLLHKSEVKVNLVGIIVENNVLTDRLTTFPIMALKVSADAKVNGTETAPVSPSQFEQFVNSVEEAAQSVTDYSYDSEAWAKGTRGGVAVPSTDETYHNNSKYYADQGAELSQEVTNLKSDLSNLKSLGREVVRPTLVQGYYSTQGEFISRTDKKSYCSPSDEFIDSTYITQLVVASGFDCQVFYYDSAKQFESWEHNYSGTYSISHEGYIKVVAVKGSWTVYELSEAYASFTLYRTNTIVDAVKASTLYRAINSIEVGAFSKGGLSQGKDDTWMSDSRMRTPILYALNDIYVEAKVASYPNACFSIQTIDNKGNFISDTGWKSSFKITKGTAFRMLCTLDASSSAVKSVSEIYAGFAWLPNLATVKDLLAYDSILSWFEHGGINNNNGNNDTWYGNARGRFVNIMSFTFDVLIHRKSGAYAIAFYDDNDSFVGQLGWIEADRMISANTKFRLMVTPNQNVSTYYSLEDVVACIELEEIPTKQYGLNPNIIWQSRNVDDSMYPPYSKWYIQAAAKNQYDRVRFNVRKTTDGYYFLCHDDTINTEARNTDGSAISSSISATGRTLAELNSYDWGIKYGAIYQGASVPLLDDALKYSALYNLGVSIEFSSLSGWTDSDTANVLAMCDKYGITDNLIVIDPAGLDIPFLQKFIAHNKRISLYVGAVSSWWTDTNVARVNSLLTEYNNVYVQLYPWGTLPTTEFINLAKANDWKLYSSTPMTKSALLTEDMFNKGFSLIEANNVYMVKNTVRDWVDGLLNF